MVNPNQEIPNYERWSRRVLWAAIPLLVVLACCYMFFQLVSGFQRYQQNDDFVLEEDEELTENERRMLERAESVLDRANESAEMAGTILSFLEGASVLVALALGAAAIFGFQNSRELRKDIQEESDKIGVELRKFDDLWRQNSRELREDIQKQSDKITALLEQIRPVEKSLLNLDENLAAYEKAQKSIQDNIVDLLQASQELSLKNYPEAHRYALEVLKRSPDNILALYIAGWLETQYIPGQLELACQRLNRAIELDKDSLSVKAAYGVALRRKALASPDKNIKNSFFHQSLGFLEQALGVNKKLIDLNRESFWGPMGGNYRDLDQIDSAINAYEEARKVTPGSSYPIGNLGALYLLNAKRTGDEGSKQKALERFRLTADTSQRELGFSSNDYFVLMDLAMSYTMLGVEDEKNYGKARQHLEQALSNNIEAAPGMLQVSLGGWQRLLEACPNDWEQVKRTIEAAIQDVEKVLQERQPPE